MGVPPLGPSVSVLHSTLPCLAFAMVIGGLSTSCVAWAAKAHGGLRCVLLVTSTWYMDWS